MVGVLSEVKLQVRTTVTFTVVASVIVHPALMDYAVILNIAVAARSGVGPSLLSAVVAGSELLGVGVSTIAHIVWWKLIVIGVAGFMILHNHT